MFLKIEKLSKKISGVSIFGNVNINMDCGEIITIVGNSGCGKSTLLKAIAGLYTDYTGAIVLDGEKIDSLEAGKRPLSLLFQEPTLFPHLNVIENVAFPLKCRGIKKNERHKIALKLLESLNLSQLSERFIYELSGGQKQRIALAQAIILKPKLLLLDEPFSKLDLTLSREIMSFMKNIIKLNKITTIFVTHNYEEAKIMSNRIFVFSSGEVKEDFSELADEFFGDGLYIDGVFVSIDKLVLNEENGIPVTILSKIKIHGADFILFKTIDGLEKLIKAPSTINFNESTQKQWYICKKDYS